MRLEPWVSSFNYAIKSYQEAGNIWPTVDNNPKRSNIIENLTDIVDNFEIIVFDSFGVLNLGSQNIIQSSLELIKKLQNELKPICVMTNNSERTLKELHIKYKEMGYRFSQQEIISSRDSVIRQLKNHKKPMRWLVYNDKFSDISDLPKHHEYLCELSDRNYKYADGFLILSSGPLYSEQEQNRILTALHNTSRPVIIGNADMTAPHPTHYTMEPGYLGYQLSLKTKSKLYFNGKPFPEIYNIFQEKFAKILNKIPSNKVLMVGDTLYTDILGANKMGWTSALMADYGLYSQQNVEQMIKLSGIMPHYIISKNRKLLIKNHRD